MTKKICAACDGRGQTRKTRTTFKFVPKHLPNGRIKEQYVTEQMGSGCPKCLGVGYTK
jgi:DnaJ-class molecular chaperone